jgi:glycogen debranching enzyme
MRDITEKHFWLEDRGFYALAVDGNDEPCQVLASNAAHLLFVGLPNRERGRAVWQRLISSEFNSGFGIRTLGTGEVRFNPMSYHNGSIWPHDTAIALAGMARYGEREWVARIIGDMFDAALHFEMRLPELYCGFTRHGACDAPVAYPVACMPQAWASGSVFMMLQACLGVSVDAWRKEIRIDRPRLPPGVDQLDIRGLDVVGQKVNLTFQRVGPGVVAYSDQHFAGAVPIVQQM